MLTRIIVTVQTDTAAAEVLSALEDIRDADFPVTWEQRPAVDGTGIRWTTD